MFESTHLWLPAERHKSGSGQRGVRKVQKRDQRQNDEAVFVQHTAGGGGRPPHLVQVQRGERDAADDAYATEKRNTLKKETTINY